MSALEQLISLADGTTDESMHVCVPVSLIRELQAWMPGEKERLTTNGAKAWAGVDPQSLRDEPEHVQQAGIDADMRAMAIYGARRIVRMNTWSSEGDKMAPYPVMNAHQLENYQAAIRILRHFGLIVEHGDGVVSIRDNVGGEAHAPEQT